MLRSGLIFIYKKCPAYIHDPLYLPKTSLRDELNSSNNHQEIVDGQETMQTDDTDARWEVVMICRTCNYVSFFKILAIQIFTWIASCEAPDIQQRLMTTTAMAKNSYQCWREVVQCFE